MSKYLITLTPLGPFYFGGERSFPLGNEDKNELASYIIESNKFPQQTSLLGMLRFWILRNSDAFDPVQNKIIKQDDAVTLIGKRGFYAAKEEENFGVIKTIGPCFLQKVEKSQKDKQEAEGKVTTILPTPLDYRLKLDFTKGQKAIYNGDEKTLPSIEYIEEENDNEKVGAYISKEGLCKKYISIDKKLILEEGDIFQKDQRIGIKRDSETGQTAKENGLYKQVFYRLQDGFRFAFLAEFIDEDKLPKERRQVVELGGDSSKFVLEYNKCNPENEELKYPDTLPIKIEGEFRRTVLLSDSLICTSKENKDCAKFSITEHIPFSFLIFDTSSSTKYSREKDCDNKSTRYSLFKRGSVFYFENEENQKAFEKAVKNPAFEQIGYNQIQSQTIK